MKVMNRGWLAMFLVAVSGVVVAEVPVMDLARHPTYKDAKISPDGDYVAVTGIVGEKTVLSLIRLADKSGVNVNPRNTNEDVGSFEWVAPDRVMYSVTVHSGTALNPAGTGELYTVKADGTGSALIFGVRAGNERQSTGTNIQVVTSERATGELISPLRDDPTHALIASYPWLGTGNSSDVNPTAYKIDLRDGKKVRMSSSPLRGAKFLADNKGVIRMYYGSTDDTIFIGKVFYRDSADGEWTQVAGGNAEAFAPIQFDRGNESVYAYCKNGNSICKWNSKTRKLDTLWTSADGAKGYLVPTFDGLDAFAIRTHAGRPATALLDKNAPEAAALISVMKQLPGVDVEIINATRDGKKAILLASGGDDPGVFYLYETETKKLTALLERRSWIKPGRMAQMEPIALKARDGLDLHGYLTLPPSKEQAKNLPTVVMVHGGPYGVFDVWGYDSDVQLFATRGYAVLQVNVRGSGGYDGEFIKAGYREWGNKMQDDVTDATRWAIDRGIADAGRICIYGSSYGGYAALRGVSKEPDLYRCAIGYVGIYDLNLWSRRSDLIGSASSEGYLDNVLGKDATDLAARSPVGYADRIKAKVMLVVGGADERVPKAQGESMRLALEKAGNPPEWIYERTEGHGFYDEKHVADLYEKMLAFLDKNIGSGNKAVEKK